MQSSRRSLLLGLFSGVTAFFARSQAVSAQNPAPLPPSRRNTGDRDESPNPPPGATKAVLEQHQKDIKKDVEKLYELASELKTEVEKTDATVILSMAMLKKTEEIEKLAKQIRDHAKG